jgi:hypothetical protein
MTDSLLASFFPRPSDDDRMRRRADLLLRAASVRRWGWDDYRYQWSTGEVVAVAALLGDSDVLSDMGETLQTAYRRCAYDLWGMVDAQADEAADLRATRKWFSETAADIERAFNDPEFEQSLREIRGWWAVLPVAVRVAGGVTDSFAELIR